MLKKFIFVTTFFFFVISPAYAQLPNFADLVEDVSPAVVKINTVIKGPKQSAQQNFQGQLQQLLDCLMVKQILFVKLKKQHLNCKKKH